MSNTNACRHETLAANGIALVQRCTECGCVSIHLGPTTVRLDESALEALSVVLGEATAELHAQKERLTVHSLARGIA